MKIEQTILKNGLGLVAKAVANRPTLPVLAHVKLSIENDNLNLTTTDLEKSISVNIECQTEIDETWDTTIPFSLFNEYISSLNDTIELSYEDLNGNLSIECNQTTGVFKTLDATEFPIALQIPDTQPLEFNCAELAVQLSSVLFGASADEARPILTGVLFQAKNDIFTTVTADGFRMAVYESERKGDEFSLVIPAHFVSDLLSVISKHSQKNVKVYTTDRQAFFLLDDIIMISQLIEGHFPDYVQILPKAHSVKITVNRNNFAKEVRRLAIIARKSDNILTIDLQSEQLYLTADSPDIGAVEGFVDATIEGELYTTNANCNFLLAALAVLDKDIIIEQNGTATPIKLYSDENCTQIIMPMHKKSAE